MVEQNTIKVAIVTGASRGIGASIALELAKNNILVIGTATSDKGVKSIQDNFKHAVNHNVFPSLCPSIVFKNIYSFVGRGPLLKV